MPDDRHAQFAAAISQLISDAPPRWRRRPNLARLRRKYPNRQIEWDNTVKQYIDELRAGSGGGGHFKAPVTGRWSQSYVMHMPPSRGGAHYWGYDYEQAMAIYNLIYG